MTRKAPLNKFDGRAELKTTVQNFPRFPIVVTVIAHVTSQVVLF